MKKQGFLYGSAVLMVSALIVKIMGAVFRIPLANMLGGTELIRRKLGKDAHAMTCLLYTSDAADD